jgi:hypothetical protein
MQHRLDDHARALVEAARRASLFVERGCIPLRFVLAQRTPKRAQPERAHERVAAFGIAS